MNVVDDGVAQRPLSLFPPQSVTLVTSASNSGKTHFLRQVVDHPHLFFEPNQVSRVVYINGASSAETWSPANPALPTESLPFEDVETHGDWLEEGDLVILDDVLRLTPGIVTLLKYSAHHRGATVFVVTQSLIGDRLYALTYLVHYCVLLLHTSTAARVAVELLQRFFVAADTKRYLRGIVSEAEKLKSIVVLKLNPVASAPPLLNRVLCFSRVDQLAQANFCLAHPELAYMDELFENFQRRALDDVPDQQLVLVPAGVLKKQPAAVAEVDDSHAPCTKEQHWDELNASLNSDIETVFPMRRWVTAKALTREILKNPNLCISHDFRQILLNEHPNLCYNFIDFLQVAVRKAGPNEDARQTAHYLPLVKVLLAANIPRTFLINRQLWPTENRRHGPASRPPFVKRLQRSAGHPKEHHFDPQGRGL